MIALKLHRMFLELVSQNLSDRELTMFSNPTENPKSGKENPEEEKSLKCKDHDEEKVDLWSSGEFICESCYLEYMRAHDFEKGTLVGRDEYSYAGTVDIIGTLDGKDFVIDCMATYKKENSN